MGVHRGDLVLIGVVVVFFVAAWAYTQACESVGRSDYGSRICYRRRLVISPHRLPALCALETGAVLELFSTPSDQRRLVPSGSGVGANLCVGPLPGGHPSPSSGQAPIRPYTNSTSVQPLLETSMSFNGWWQILIFFLVILAVTKPIGLSMFRVFAGSRQPLPRFFRPIERGLYRLCGVDPKT